MDDLLLEDDVTAGATELTDDELTALALAADPDIDVPDDAVSFWALPGNGDGGASVLPSWYMPAPMGSGPTGRRWLRRAIAITIIVAFLVIDAYGLCSTYGQITVA